MNIAITIAVFGVAVLFVLFFLARRMLRLAVRLALALVLVLILIAGGLFWMWSHAGNSSAQNSNRTATPSRRNTSR